MGVAIGGWANTGYATAALTNLSGLYARFLSGFQPDLLLQ